MLNNPGGGCGGGGLRVGGGGGGGGWVGGGGVGVGKRNSNNGEGHVHKCRKQCKGGKANNENKIDVHAEVDAVSYAARRGRAVQVEPMKPVLESAWNEALEAKI